VKVLVGTTGPKSTVFFLLHSMFSNAQYVVCGSALLSEKSGIASAGNVGTSQLGMCVVKTLYILSKLLKPMCLSLYVFILCILLPVRLSVCLFISLLI